MRRSTIVQGAPFAVEMLTVERLGEGVILGTPASVTPTRRPRKKKLADAQPDASLQLVSVIIRVRCEQRRLVVMLPQDGKTNS